MGSHKKCIEPFQKVLALALLDYIRLMQAGAGIEEGKKLIAKLYNSFGSLGLEYRPARGNEG